MAHLPRRIVAEINATLRSPQTAALVAGLENTLTRRRRAQKMKSGAFRGLHVEVYRGFIADHLARVRVRVTESPELPGDSRIPYWEVAQANLRRHAALGIADAPVELSIGRHRGVEVTDRHGYANFALPVANLGPGWHPAVAVTGPIEGGQSASGTGRVIRPAGKAPMMVISDIDDTILLTGITEGIAMVARTVLREAGQRAAIPGMASLYRGLARGVPSRTGKRAPEPTFFYVSTGSWSFYPMLEEFMQLRGFPQGPMFLTDWGPSERYLRRSGEEHKRAAIRRLLLGYPDTPVLLVGDSGQHDPLTYAEVAREFPGRVRLILIRQIGDESDERNVAVRALASTLRADGVELQLFSDAVEAAECARQARWCDAETVIEVRTEPGGR